MRILLCRGALVPKGPFTAEEFIATQWNAAENKAGFGTISSVSSKRDSHRTCFTKTLYNRLSMCLQHIAHYVKGLIVWSAGANTAFEHPSAMHILTIQTLRPS